MIRVLSKISIKSIHALKSNQFDLLDLSICSDILIHVCLKVGHCILQNGTHAQLQYKPWWDIWGRASGMTSGSVLSITSDGSSCSSSSVRSINGGLTFGTSNSTISSGSERFPIVCNIDWTVLVLNWAYMLLDKTRKRARSVKNSASTYYCAAILI